MPPSRLVVVSRRCQDAVRRGFTSADVAIFNRRKESGRALFLGGYWGRYSSRNVLAGLHDCSDLSHVHVFCFAHVLWESRPNEGTNLPARVKFWPELAASFNLPPAAGLFHRGLHV